MVLKFDIIFHQKQPLQAKWFCNLISFLDQKSLSFLSADIGCLKKTFTLGISLIFASINILESYGIFHLKGGIHISILSTNPFMYKDPRYKQIEMENNILKILGIEQS